MFNTSSIHKICTESFNHHKRSGKSYFYGSTDDTRSLTAIVMLLSSASLQTDFCADLKDDQTRGTRRKPVPKQRCISAPHGTSSTLPCWRLCNRSGALAGKQTRLPTSPSPLRLLLQLHRVKTIVLAFFFFFEPLYLSLVSSAAIRAFCCCTPPGKAKLRFQRGSLVLSYTTSLCATPDDLHLLVDRAGR